VPGPCIRPAYPGIECDAIIDRECNRRIQHQGITWIDGRPAILARQIEAVVPRKHENDWINRFVRGQPGGPGLERVGAISPSLEQGPFDKSDQRRCLSVFFELVACPGPGIQKADVRLRANGRADAAVLAAPSDVNFSATRDPITQCQGLIS